MSKRNFTDEELEEITMHLEEYGLIPQRSFTQKDLLQGEWTLLTGREWYERFVFEFEHTKHHLFNGSSFTLDSNVTSSARKSSGIV